MNGTEHHCDTCTCTPVPDLNAALQAVATLDVRGAYSVRIDLDGQITLQGDAPNMADLINSQVDLPLDLPVVDELASIADTCCGKCPGDTCYVDQVTGA